MTAQTPASTPAETFTELKVLYRDEHLLVVDKPSGLLVHRGWANDRDTALSRARRLAGQWVYPAHRLDRGTSGILVFTLHSEAARRLHQQFVARHVGKTYLALVRGFCPNHTEIDHPLARQKGLEKRSAQTIARCLERFELPSDNPYPRRYSLVEAKPLTGRPHQVRRHLKHISHPLVGDVRYGKSEHNQFFRTQVLFSRLALHAHAVRFSHPMSSAPMELTLPLASDMAQAVGRLRQLGSS